jgi:hypothetical protein
MTSRCVLLMVGTEDGIYVCLWMSISLKAADCRHDIRLKATELNHFVGRLLRGIFLETDVKACSCRRSERRRGYGRPHTGMRQDTISAT